jgi:hypothetical protein
MIIFHAVQKLLNTSRIKPVLFVSHPNEGQQLHSWYARLLSTGLPGKLLVIYVHEPSLMTIVCKGKSALPEKQAEAALKKGNLVEIHNADKSEKYFVATDPYYKTMMVFDAEGKKQYVHHSKKMSNAVKDSISEKQEVKPVEKSKVETEKKTKKKKVSIKM